MGRRIVIFAGGRLGDWALHELRDGDLAVGADRGALFLIRHGIRPHIAFGDFDSVTEREKLLIREQSGQTVECDPVMKDLTDMEMALNWAMEQKPAEIVLCGALGSRFDHSLANAQLLVRTEAAGIPGVIVDAFNRLTVIVPGTVKTLRRSRFSYVSLLPLTPTVGGVTLEGFKYPLSGAELRMGYTLAVSNEFADDAGTVRIEDGLLLIVESADERPEGGGRR